MAYVASIGNNVHTVDTGESGPQREISIDGVRYDIDWRQIAPLATDTHGQSSIGGRYSLLIGGKSYEIFARRVMRPDEAGYRYEILIGGQRFEITVEDEREKALAGSIQGAHETEEA